MQFISDNEKRPPPLLIIYYNKNYLLHFRSIMTLSKNIKDKNAKIYAIYQSAFFVSLAFLVVSHYCS